jgi:glutamate 5-kinase
MQGVIVITAEAGRALRKGHAGLLAAAVLDCSGAFQAGDRVYIATRGKDGGQSVLATGVIRCGAPVLLRPAAGRFDASDPVRLGDLVVMHEQDVQLLWP